MVKRYIRCTLFILIAYLAIGIIGCSAAAQGQASGQVGPAVQIWAPDQMGTINQDSSAYPYGAVCKGMPTDTLTDSLNCGGCGDYCAPGSVCTNGVCACFRELTSCNGTCVSTKFDDKNCGFCGNRCPPGTTCLDGACSCPQLTVPCNGRCVDMHSDNNNCGWCSHVCPRGTTCFGGACVKTKHH